MIKKEQTKYFILFACCISIYLLDAKSKKKFKKKHIPIPCSIINPIKPGLFTQSVDRNGKSAASLFFNAGLKKPIQKTGKPRNRSWSGMLFEKNRAFETRGAVVFPGVLPTLFDLLCWTVFTNKMGITAPLNGLPSWSPRI